MRDFIFNGLSPVIKVGVTPFWPSGFVFHVSSVTLLAELPILLTEYVSCRP
jgi:hypothetical protein